MTEPMSLDVPLADRISAARAPSNRGRGGPNQGGGPRRGNRTSPYTRPTPAPEGQWRHDKFGEQNGNAIRGGSLAARLSGGPVHGGGNAGGGGRVGQVDTSRAAAALLQATSHGRTSAPARGGGGALSIKGASGSTVEVKELATGTTPADVEMIFQQCGKILSSKLSTAPEDDETVTVHVKFSKRADALKAVDTFNGQQADGRVLSVSILEESGILDRFDAQRIAPEIDLLQSAEGGGGMRSDSLVNAPGAQVMTAPPRINGPGRGGRR